YVTQSSAQYWVGFPGTQSVDLGRPISASIATSLYMEPNISHVERFLLGSGDWRGARGGGTSINIVGIDARPRSIGLSTVVPPAMRNLLQQPGTALVDATDRHKLAIDVGDTAEVNGRRIHIVGLIEGLR
ncbi:hypothetical protein LXJ56_27715, partial [Escherichia coli]|nr:hypothetical protein [Escherichia coli]